MLETYRTFIAIELPPKIRMEIKQHTDQLRDKFPDIRASWTCEENLHLTLKFLGDVPVTSIPALSEATEKAVRAVSRFELIVGGCGAFPPHGRPKVLWIGIDDAPQARPEAHAGSAGILPVLREPQASNLQRLYDAVENECAQAGFERETRAYHPHLTIARLRTSTGSSRLGQLHKELGFTPQPVAVSEIAVFRSELRSEGSLHTVLSRHELKNA